MMKQKIKEFIIFSAKILSGLFILIVGYFNAILGIPLGVMTAYFMLGVLLGVVIDLYVSWISGRS